MPKIIVQKDTEIVRTYNLPGKNEITFGCSTGCDVPIEDPSIAPEQAKIILQDDGFHLRLLSHIPPVFVTGERVEGDVLLQDGDTVRIEGYELILNVLPDEIKVVEPPPEPEKPAPEEPAPKPVEKEVPQEVTPEPEIKEVPRPAPAAREEAPKPEPKPVPEPEPPIESEVKAEPEPEHIETIKTREVKAAPSEPPPQQEIAKPEPAPKPAEEPPPREVEKPKPVEPEPAVPPEEKRAPQEHKTKVLPVAEAVPRPRERERPVHAEEDMYLLAVAGPLKGEKFRLKKGPNNIGRDRKKNEIVIRADARGELDKSISRQHARIDYSDNVYYLSDSQSQMRTKLNGNTVSKTEKLILKTGDIIEICSMKESTVFRFAAEGAFDFSPPGERHSEIPGMGIPYLPYLLIAAAVVVIIIVLILILK
jgi:predicted component of type VI protein secretion system